MCVGVGIVKTIIHRQTIEKQVETVDRDSGKGGNTVLVFKYTTSVFGLDPNKLLLGDQIKTFPGDPRFVRRNRNKKNNVFQKTCMYYIPRLFGVTPLLPGAIGGSFTRFPSLRRLLGS